jgi:hypothetical protein
MYSTGTVSGLSGNTTDLDRFNGDSAALLAFASVAAPLDAGADASTLNRRRFRYR